MNKSELKFGMFVQLRNGVRYAVKNGLLHNDYKEIDLFYYHENLRCSNPELDIMRVYELDTDKLNRVATKTINGKSSFNFETGPFKLLWDRGAQLNYEDYCILNMVQNKWKWLLISNSGHLFVSKKEPEVSNGDVYSYMGMVKNQDYVMFRHMFNVLNNELFQNLLPNRAYNINELIASYQSENQQFV